MRYRLFSAGILSILLSLVLAGPVQAQSKPGEVVQLEVPDTTLTLTGYAAPGALVTFAESGSVIGTVVADSTGAYSTVLSSQPSGIRTISTSFTDAQGVDSKTLTQSVSVQSQQNTTLDAFLSPTVTRRTPEVTQQGSLVQVSGYTVANSTVSLSLGLSGFSLQIVSDANGFYEFLVPTDELEAGSYSVLVSTTLVNLATSGDSLPVGFTVVVDSGPASPDIIVAPDQLPPPVPETPDDGATIEGSSVVITGESVANAQINIIENGVLIGSIFADEFGRWSFVYEANTSPVTLSFEACIDGRCSVLSKSITLNFTAVGDCDVDFHLDHYRFWGIRSGSEVKLDIATISGGGVLKINWGDGVVEEFDYDPNQPMSYPKIYEKRGLYNGEITYYQGHSKQESNCQLTRYFSVHVAKNQDGTFWWLLILMIVIAGLIHTTNRYHIRRS